ncbi:hypothetical protein H257_14933 [Aphanomyces astaci]|uniref:Uncharacterized protein n=1 Tax=Aphanomyces astaci TaxID=112090 RepID=W4FRL9_APHAT|nr:hypothetical protein H257_14933 [Aphanomyces astaci]ETV69308.1 hypothetical protein H257_14933 [Aphanomyces astaci]RQM27837.1 hypothetical protein B5M09_007871 [Aphanomyces astaci]|eukprot:XP_009841165.1 hypothetical protein H257_14933 [Aphanomyces astaci]
MLADSSPLPSSTSPLRRRIHDTNNPSFRKSMDESRRREVNLDTLKKLAQDATTTFSDDESDGVTSDDDDDIDVLDTVLVPTSSNGEIPRHWTASAPPTLLPIKTPVPVLVTTVKPSTVDVDASWTLVDKSPTFENVRLGKTSLGGENWSL